MTRLFILLAALALSGCAAVAGNVPSLQYCNEIEYQRSGNKIHFCGECEAPIGGGAPPVPGL